MLKSGFLAVSLLRLGKTRKKRIFRPHVYFRCAKLSSCIIAILCILLVVFSVCFVYRHASAVILETAKSRGTLLVTDLISDSVNSVIVESGYSYTDFADISRTEDGKISSILIKTEKVNVFKSEIVKKITLLLDDNDKMNVRLPLGSLLNKSIFSGTGPPVSVPLSPNGSLTVDFDSSFTDAGINQTKHDLGVKISVNLSVMAIGKDDEFTVTETVPICSAIIVGSSPSGYTKIEK